MYYVCMCSVYVYYVCVFVCVCDYVSHPSTTLLICVYCLPISMCINMNVNDPGNDRDSRRRKFPAPEKGLSTFPTLAKI